MREPGDGIGLVRPAQPDQERTSRVQRNASAIVVEEPILAWHRGCFVQKSLELRERSALHRSCKGDFPCRTIGEDVKIRVVEKTGHSQRGTLASAWVFERGILSCHRHRLVRLRATAARGSAGGCCRRWLLATERSESATTRAPGSRRVERLESSGSRELGAVNGKMRPRGIGGVEVARSAICAQADPPGRKDSSAKRTRWWCRAKKTTQCNASVNARRVGRSAYFGRTVWVVLLQTQMAGNGLAKNVEERWKEKEGGSGLSPSELQHPVRSGASPGAKGSASRAAEPYPEPRGQHPLRRWLVNRRE